MKSEERKINPFVENEGYVDRLVSEVTETAITKRKDTNRYALLMRAAAAMALVVTIGGVSWMYTNSQKVEEAPLDAFLNSISDEEASMLENYYVEDVYIEEWE